MLDYIIDLVAVTIVIGWCALLFQHWRARLKRWRTPPTRDRAN